MMPVTNHCQCQNPLTYRDSTTQTMQLFASNDEQRLVYKYPKRVRLLLKWTI